MRKVNGSARAKIVIGVIVIVVVVVVVVAYVA